MTGFEMHWGEWTAEGLYLFLLILLLVLTVVEWRRAYYIEGRRLLVIPILAAPWVVELLLGIAFPFGGHRGAPGWIGQAIEVAAIANPVLWVAVFMWLYRAWRCILPFVAFNLCVAAPVSLFAGCSWAGACL